MSSFLVKSMSLGVKFCMNENKIYHLNEVTSQLNNPDDFENISDVFKILSDPNRLKIFLLLCHIEECVIEIADITKMTTPAVSHHLKLLKLADLVESKRKGREVYYKATENQKSQLLHRVIEQTLNTVCPTNLKDMPSEKAINYSKDVVELIREVHDYLILNLDKRITIDELSKNFHINKTSLKEIFKDLYGVSIAKHINEHRMEKAAFMLKNTSENVSEIAKKVGFQTQSKFTLSFKEYYRETPLRYRKNKKDEI